MTDVTAPLAPASATTSDISVPPPVDASKTPASPPAAAAEPDKEGTSPPEAAPENPDNPEPPKKRPASERISELYAQKKAAERRADEAVRVAQELRQQLQTPPNIDPNDFNAQESDRVRRAVKAERFEQTVTDARAAQAAKVESVAVLFDSKVDEARARIPDLDQVLPTIRSLPLSFEACDLIAESDKAVEVAYYLAKNPAEATKLGNLPLHKQGAEIARIEAKVASAPTARKTSNAPPPVPTIAGATTPTGRKDPAEMSMEEYADFYAQRRAKRR